MIWISVIWQSIYHLMETGSDYIDSGGVFHTERFLKWSMRELPIRRTSVWVSILRKDNTIEGPWHNTAWDDPDVSIPIEVIKAGTLNSMT
mgnify:CR=1 FL=1